MKSIKFTFVSMICPVFLSHLKLEFLDPGFGRLYLVAVVVAAVGMGRVVRLSHLYSPGLC